MSLKGLKILVTAGPTHEPIDPVRYIANRSSGKQGYAIAHAMAETGADVTLISGPTQIKPPESCTVITVQTAQEMYDACIQVLPVDIAIMTAAVADWSPVYASHKIKKDHTDAPPVIQLKENPDILKTLANHKNRPKLVIGFAAETDDLIKNAQRKRERKNCDWIVANDVSQNVFGADQNHVYLITRNDVTEWERMAKTAVAQKLMTTILEEIK